LAITFEEAGVGEGGRNEAWGLSPESWPPAECSDDDTVYKHEWPQYLAHFGLDYIYCDIQMFFLRVNWHCLCSLNNGNYGSVSCSENQRLC
jgi:hypothetical protein